MHTQDKPEKAKVQSKKIETNSDLETIHLNETRDLTYRQQDVEHTSYLSASGFTDSNNGIYDWAKTAMNAVKLRLTGSIINGCLWAYRHQDVEYISLSFEDETEKNYSFTITTGFPYELKSISEPIVPDMTEALHMAGIIIQALEANMLIGRGWNEVNRYCIPEPFKEG